VRRLRRTVWRAWALVRSREADRDIDEEIAGHLAEATDEYLHQGFSREEAHRAALRSFGGVLQAKEVHRQVRSFGWLDDVRRDLRFSTRMLAKDRWMTLAGLVTLAIGMAANITVFTIVHGILLRGLPFAEPDRIVAIGARLGNARTLTSGVSYADFQDWRAAARTFDGLAAVRETTMNVGDERVAPERFIGSYISADAFTLIGHRPMLGREFSPDDDRPGAIPVVILGQTLWRNRYAANPDVLGRTIRVNGIPSVVIGVMPEGFGFPTRSRLWQPLALLPETTLASRGARDLSAFGRLAPGMTPEQGVAELTSIGAALAERYPDTNRELMPTAAPYHLRSVGGRARDTLPVLIGVVGVVLLMACANVANLLLARAAVRSHEISVRIAIGAGRRQIVRQLLIESLLLASLAGVAGFGLSLAAVRVIDNALAGLGGGDVGLPYWIHFTMDARVFAFSAALCLTTTLLFGLVPALHTSTPPIAHSLRRRRWAHGLVVFQLALAPILLTAGGLMMRSIVAQYEMHAGADTAGIMWARVDLPPANYPGAEDRVRFYQQLDDRLADAPGLTAGLVSNAPFNGGAARNLWRDDEPLDGDPRRPRVLMVLTGPRYFETFRKGLIRGSELPLRGSAGDAPPVMLNEWLAATVFPSEDPIGRRIRLTLPNGAPYGAEWFTIAGIAPDIRQASTEDNSGRHGVVYASYATYPMAQAGIVARSDADASVVANVLRERVRQVDPDLPLFEVMTVDDLLAASDERVGARVFGTMFVVFAVVALLLAAVGLYAVTAYAAAQRTREFGVRVALGAQAAHIWWLVARNAAWQLGIGLSIGMAGAIGVGFLLQGVLIGTSALDPVTLSAVAGLLALVGVSASVLPARRAMRLDPAVILRTE
jgi:predicted permease